MDLIHWIIGIGVSFLSAWGITKYAMANFTKRLDSHDSEFSKIRDEITDLATDESVEKIRAELKEVVQKADCRTMQSGCGTHIAASNAEVTKRLDQLTTAISENEKNQNEQKDVRNAAIARLTTQIAVLDRTIKLRSFAYRGSNGVCHIPEIPDVTEPD